MTYEQIFVKVCLEYACVSVPYFMDEMQAYELYPILKNLDISIRNGWEQTRNLMYAIVQMQSTKHLKPSDILKFPWDSNGIILPKNTNITKEYVEKMKQKAMAERENLINKGLISNIKNKE